MEEVFGSLQTKGGYTPAEIRAMRLPDVLRLLRYWKRVPPLRDIVAGFLGWVDEPPAGTGPKVLAGDMPEYEE